MVVRTIEMVTIGSRSLIEAVMFTSMMAIKGMNKNAASIEAGGVRRWMASGLERRVVDVGRLVGTDHVVPRAFVVVAMDLIAVTSSNRSRTWAMKVSI